MNLASNIISESINESSLPEAITFLRKHENYTLFLLGNLDMYGYKLGDSPNSGHFKLLRQEGKIVAVFCLTKRGNLLVHSESTEEIALEKILADCQAEHLPILGVLGQFEICKPLWDLIKKKSIVTHETYVSKEILYAAELSRQDLAGNAQVRLLTPKDFPQWKPLRSAYIKEKKLPSDPSEEQMKALFLEKVNAKISWGYFLDGKLVAIADLNAKAPGLGQVGGVYTAPAHRKKGLALAVMHQLIKDAKNIHGIRKLIIFTGENNHPARKLYESLKATHAGYYALFFGKR